MAEQYTELIGADEMKIPTSIIILTYNQLDYTLTAFVNILKQELWSSVAYAAERS